jgi:hypothetical protein
MEMAVRQVMTEECLVLEWSYNPHDCTTVIVSTLRFEVHINGQQRFRRMAHTLAYIAALMI